MVKLARWNECNQIVKARCRHGSWRPRDGDHPLTRMADRGLYTTFLHNVCSSEHKNINRLAQTFWHIEVAIIFGKIWTY